MFQDIRLHPSRWHFVASELAVIILDAAVFAATGCEGLLPDSLSSLMIGFGILIALYLLYRYLYLLRTIYVVTDEQLRYETGVFSRKTEFIELYRVVDYSEQRSFLQMLTGLKTVSIYSGDKTMPRLDLVGIRYQLDLIALIRKRVELNKKHRNIHEFTNIR